MAALPPIQNLQNQIAAVKRDIANKKDAIRNAGSDQAKQMLVLELNHLQRKLKRLQVDLDIARRAAGNNNNNNTNSFDTNSSNTLTNIQPNEPRMAQQDINQETRNYLLDETELPPAKATWTNAAAVNTGSI